MTAPTTIPDSLGIILGIYAAVTFGFFAYQRRRRNRRKFFQLLWKGLGKDAIKSVSDVNNLMEGIYGRNDGVQGQDYPGMLFLLRAALVIAFENGDDSLLKHKEILTKLIAECETNKPYSDLPPEEKNIFVDAEAHLKSNNTEHVHQKLVELAARFRALKGIIEKQEKSGKLSNVLAVVGIVLSVIFGLK